MAKKKSPALRSVGDALASPQTRQERYLANIAGLVATKPEYPFTRLERYLDAIAQSTGGSAEAIEELKQNKLNIYGRGVNLLDNWYFVGEQFPINQKRQTSYNGSGYGIDRWISTANVTVTVNQSNVAVAFETGYAANSKTFSQKIGGYIPSGLFNMSYIVDEITGNINTRIRFTDANDVYVGQILGGNASNGMNTFSGVVPQGAKKCSVEFRNSDNSGGSVGIVAAKLELGDKQTLAHQDAGGNWVLNDPPPNFQQELAKCQRYFQVFRDQYLIPTFGMDYRPPMANGQPTQSSFVLDGVTYYTASAEL